MENSGRALELYGQGHSINSVSKALGITWAEAKKLQPSLVPKEPKRKPGRKPAPRKEKEPPADERWELGIKVPLERAVAIFSEFTPEEKIYVFSELPAQKQMDAIMDVLQRRMDSLCASPVTAETLTGNEASNG